MATPVNLWHGRLAAEAADLGYYRQLLASDELSYAQQLKNWHQQNYYVQTHGLLRILIGQFLRINPQTLIIAKGQYGKPYLPDYPGLAFNLSHSGNYLAIALAENCNLGLDVELIKPRANFSGLVAKCFAKTESEYWHKLPDPEKQAAFYRFWTSKEAFVKATGRGIALGMQECVLEPAETWHFSSLPTGCGLPSAWQISHLQLSLEVSCSLVIESAQCPLIISNLIHIL